MKRLSAVGVFILVIALMPGSVFAQAQYLIDGVNPLALNLVTVPPNDCQAVTIALDPGGEITTPLVSGGCWITWDTSQVAIVNVDAIEYPDGPWDVGATVLIPEAGGPGTYFVSLGLFATVPINQGPIPLCDVESCSEGPGQSQITISTIPSFDTFVGDTTVWDPDIDDGIVNLTIEEDTDGDGISDGNDNCPTTPNGSDLGTCTEGTVGETCTSNDDCYPNGVCSMNQEDMDLDGVGDVCDDVQMCKGNFDYDGDVDGTDAAVFKAHFGRSTFTNPCPPDGPAPVEKTHQTISYTTGDDGEHQSGVPFPEPRFVDNEDGTIRDNLTGLIWLRNADCFGQRLWADAISDCNGLESGSCGLTDGSNAGDWRLPHVKEIQSLIDFNQYEPALPFGHLFSSVQSSYYWSSTTYAAITTKAWSTVINYGYLFSFSDKTNEFNAWCVKGGH
jgi:hypothetical protein